MTGYEPLNTLKPVGEDIWIIDGPEIRFYGLPFPTRCTVVRLRSGGLWVHSPTLLTNTLRAEIDALGSVDHLVAPNWIHYASIPEWQAAYPKARAWAAPGVVERAESQGRSIRFDQELWAGPNLPWLGQIDQMIVEGSTVHREAVFFHTASKTLILTDLIENFEPRKVRWFLRPVFRLVGIADPDGKMPRDMRMTFRKNRDQLREAVETMIGWGPEQVIVSHGRWYQDNAVEELRRAFRFVL